jgi:cell division protein FtsW (lipid II flippase)
MEFVSGGNLLCLSFYLIGFGLSLSYLAEWTISKTISAKKFEISFKQIRWSRVMEFAVLTYWVLYMDIQLVEGSFFPNFLDWWTWLFLVVYLISWITGNYMARYLLYPRGDFRQAFYDALSEKKQ